MKLEFCGPKPVIMNTKLVTPGDMIEVSDDEADTYLLRADFRSPTPANAADKGSE